MPKSKKLTAVYALIMDLPLSIVVTMVALALGGNLTVERFIPSFLLAYVLTFFINFLPVGMIGFKFASKHAEENTFKFGLYVNAVISLFFVVILNIVMTAFGVFVASNGTMSEYLFAVVAGFVPCYIPTLIIAMLWHPVADKASRAICHE